MTQRNFTEVQLAVARAVKEDLLAQKGVYGLKVTTKQLEYPEKNAAKMHDLRENGMKIQEIADHVILLAS